MLKFHPPTPNKNRRERLPVSHLFKGLPGHSNMKPGLRTAELGGSYDVIRRPDLLSCGVVQAATVVLRTQERRPLLQRTYSGPGTIPSASWVLTQITHVISTSHPYEVGVILCQFYDAETKAQTGALGHS